MLNRYSTKNMREIWSLESRFHFWEKIEILVCEYWNKAGEIPNEDLENIKKNATFTVPRILEIEEKTHHDVIAFLTCLAENIGKSSRYVHYGLTSSDIVDTGFACQIQESGKLIIPKFSNILSTLHNSALKYKNTIVVGRTHGIHAEPTTLGFKLLGFYEELKRNYLRLQNAFEDVAFGKISGAVGTYSQVPLKLEQYVLEKLNLKIEPVSTQIIPRDRIAFLLQAVVLTAQALSRLATEIRLLQKTESREVEEPFQKGQKGSSAMPHKRNPIICERICGLARVIMGYEQTALQNIVLWHERDISHSSGERVIIPDSLSIIEYMLIKMNFVIQNLNVYEDNAMQVFHKTKGLIYSSRALLFISKELNILREDAYKIIQEIAMKIWDNKNGPNLKEALMNSEYLKNIPAKKWDSVFDEKDFLKKIDEIFARIKII